MSEKKYSSKTLEILKKYKYFIPVPIIKITDELGIEVYETNDFENFQSGSIKKENNKFVIYINASHPLTRKKFTIAHEIAHYLEYQSFFENEKEHVSDLKQPVYVLNRKDGEDNKKMEIEANQLAAEILMPKEIFKNEWIKANKVSDIADKFGVSQSAVAFRGANLCKTMIL